ncbi:MAG: diaminopimelate epimerase [Ignavibacteria bacterium]|nr:diaminopimelate epimerase [Ignavibacteria bacterium]
MRTYTFTKAEGAQNDFVIVEDLDRAIPVAERQAFARAACHRRRGVGADGAIFLERSDALDFTMAFYNPDGSHGSMCGNGGRCAALYALRKGLAPATMRFDVLDREYRAVVTDDAIRLYFPPPLEIREVRITTAIPLRPPLYFVHTGAPHLVVFLESIGEPHAAALDDLDVDALGRALREAPEFAPVGTNVNFLHIDHEGLVHIRTFEKGVEAETEACGTGTLAAGIITLAVRGLAPPVHLRTRGGDILTVGFLVPESGPGMPDAFSPAYYANDLFLEGPARLVFEGSLAMNNDSIHEIGAHGVMK